MVEVGRELPHNSSIGWEGRENIQSREQGREIRLRHGENLFSVYRGMQEVLVEEGAAKYRDVLGKSRSEFYFELRNKDGPLNPEMLFK